jgi:DNA-binding transcriptional LysR family regulator
MNDALDAVLRDARMLVLFDEIYRSRNMSQAAERLGLSQPTVSIWLGKLRRQLHDPLFVRTSSGVRPTPRADALIGPVREAIALLRNIVGGEGVFDPSRAERTFRVAMTDASHVTLLPRLLARLRAEAPSVRLDIVPLSAGTPRALEQGDADLVLGFIPGLGPGFHEQMLYAQDFVCLVSEKHPRIRSKLTVRAYRDEAHIGILSTASYTILDDALRKQRVERRVMLELPGFLGLATIVATTDLIATVPRMIGEALARAGGIRVLPCPLTIAGFALLQYWHGRYHNDGGHRWLRSVCVELFARRGKIPSVSTG